MLLSFNHVSDRINISKGCIWSITWNLSNLGIVEWMCRCSVLRCFLLCFMLDMWMLIVFTHCEKNRNFHLISWCGNSVGRHSFRIVSGELEIRWKLRYFSQWLLPILIATLVSFVLTGIAYPLLSLKKVFYSGKF